MRTKLITAALAFSIAASLHRSTVSAADAPPSNDALLKRIEGLEQKIKDLERKLESAPAEKKSNPPANQELEQKIKILERNRELDNEALEAKLKEKEGSSIFKVPDWITNVRLVNDLRLRYDEAFAPDRDFESRWRIRPRLRLGGIVTLKNDFEVGFRLASAPSVGKDSGGDPLSTNQTFEDNGSRKPVGVDWAFGRWTPIHTPEWTGSFAVGKTENPPNFTEDVFDVDYTPEGFAEQFSYKLNPKQTASAYLGQYVLDELQFGNRGPLLFVEQLRLESKWSEHINSALTISGLSIANPQSLTTANVPDSNHGNTRNAAGVLLNDYQLFIGDGSLTYNLDSFPFYNGPFPISLVGEYIHNFGASQDNTAYSFGVSFGRASQRNAAGITRQKGKWELSYRYQELQGDANYEELTASDNGAWYRSRPVGEPYGSFRPTFLNGLNLRGHAFRLAYAPYDFLVLDARLWLNRAINVADQGDNPEGARFLFDVVLKF
jgi:hypothetical protein